MKAKEEAVGAPLALREGLPIGLVNDIGSFAGDKETSAKHVREFCKRLREFADDMEGKESLLRMGVDSMAEDMCSNRMPPLEEQLLKRGINILYPCEPLLGATTTDRNYIQDLICNSTVGAPSHFCYSVICWWSIIAFLSCV